MSAIIILILVIGGAFMLAAAGVARESGVPKKPEEPMRRAHKAFDRSAILWALRQRESGDDPRAIGRAGERSAYQFMEGTWRMHTRAPFSSATSLPEVAHGVAEANLSYIIHQLAARRLELTPEHVAAAWAYGPAFAVSAARTEYAEHVANLYWDAVMGKGRR